MELVSSLKEDIQRYFNENEVGMPLEAIELCKGIGRIIKGIERRKKYD